MKEKVRDKLLDYGNKIEHNYTSKSEVSKKEIEFTPDKEANAFVQRNPLAYLFAVILDQGMKAEKVWAIPFILKKRLGHLDIKKIAEMSDTEITEVFKRKPILHRFPKVMALRMKSACRLIIERYDGEVENLWNDKPRSEDLHKRFDEFAGIGQKKASMATNILVRDLGIEVKDRRGIDVSYDIHIRRIFLRTGLVDRDDRDLMVQAARKLNPDYPGALDLPCWQIGRTWCHPSNPTCLECPIEEVCPKLF